MYHYFRQREPVVFNRKNMTTVSEVLRQTIDEFKGENHKQMKAPFVVYAYFESLIKKIHGCAKKKTGNAQKRGPRVLWVSYIIVRSNGETWDPFVYRGENAVLVFLPWLQTHEKWMREELAPKPIVMTKEDWAKFKAATECHICNESLR